MKKGIVTLIAMFLFYGCGNPFFYKEIKSLNSEMGIKRSYEKKIFKEIEKIIPDSNHIVYYIHPSFGNRNNDFLGIVYDYNSKRYFYIEYVDSKINIFNETDNSSFKYEKENMILYLQGKYDELLRKSNSCMYSGYNTYDYIYEINLESGNNINKRFINFFLCTDFADNK